MTKPPSDFHQRFFRHAPVAALAVDASGRIRDANPAASELFQSDGGPLDGQALAGLCVAPDECQRLLETRFGTDETRTEAQVRVRFRTGAGRILDGDTTAVRGEDGALTYLLIRDVTREQALQARLEASDLQLRAALASANEGAFSFNLQTRLGSTRGFISAFMGLASADATVGLERWLDIIDPAMRDRFESSVMALADFPTRGLDVSFQARRADGEWRWLHMRGRVTEFSRGGQPLRISGLVSDITERQALEVRLETRERQLANAIDAGAVGVWEFLPGTRDVVPIGPIRNMLGVPPEPEAIDGMIWRNRVHPDDVAPVDALSESFNSGISRAFDIEYRLRDARTGDWVWLRSQGQLMIDADGRPAAAGVLTDIDERKRLEARLANSDRLLREALDSVDAGAWSLDLGTEILRISGFPAPHLDLGGEDVELSFDDWMRSAPPEEYQRVRSLLDNLKLATRQSDTSVIDAMFGDFPMVSSTDETLWVRTRGRITEWTGDGHPARLAGTMSNITAERRLQDALRESEARLSEALEAAGEGAWRYETATGLLGLSPVMARMAGLPAREARLTLTDWSDRLDAEDLDRCRAAFQALGSGRSDTIDLILRYQCADKGRIRIHLRGRVSERNAAGTPVAATGFVSDVTERLDSRERLEAREQQLVEAVDAAALGTWRIDLQAGRLSMRGSVVAEMFEAEPEADLPFQAWFDRVHPDDEPEVRRVNLAVMRSELSSADVTCRVRMRNGEYRWYRVAGRVIERDEAGRALVSAGVMWDIDAARRLDDALQVQRQRFERIYRSTPGMMHTIDANGYIVEVSDYWLEYFGYRREEVIGRRSVDFLDPPSRARAVEQSLPELFRTGRNTNIPYRFMHKDGHGIDVLLSSFLERDGDGQPLFSYAVMSDVTPLRRVNDQLERSNRELDRFATVASHDLQEPLRKISAFASLIQRRYADKLDAEGERSLEFLVDAAQRMQRLVEDLLAYSRLANQTLHITEVDTAALLDKAIENLDASIAEAGAQIVPKSLPAIRTDATLMAQVFQNLVGNAVKYHGAEPPVIEVGARQTDGHWEFWVKDNGIGLDMRFAEKIFAPFQRLHTREEYRGTGIGLAIVRQAVERLGGSIEVESEPGKGATFRFTVPADPPAA